MAQDAKLGCTGLDTTANPYTDKRDASLVRADECVIRKPGIIEQRPGLPANAYSFGSASSRSTAGCAWLDKRILLYGSTLTQDTGSTFTDYSGTYAPPSANTAKMKFAESAKRLFFTTSTGPHVLDELTGAAASSTEAGNPRLAGMPRGLEATGGLTGASGQVAPDRARAYRHVWGYIDATGAAILGPPSSRLVVSSPASAVVPIASLARTSNVNTATVAAGHTFTAGQSVTVAPGEANFAAGTYVVTAVTETTFSYAETAANAVSTAEQTFTPATGNVTLTIPIPSGITTQHFVQLYASRTAASAATDPGDELWQVAEETPTLQDITNGTVSVVDIATDALLGPPLYSNANQEGQDQANDRPPLCRDITEFNGSTVYVGTTEPHRLFVTLLGASGGGGLADSDDIVITDGTTTINLAAGLTTIEDNQTFRIYSIGSASQRVEKSARSFVRAVNLNSGGIRAYYISGPSDPGGRIMLEASAVGGSQIRMSANSIPHRRDTWYPPLRTYFAFTQMDRAANVVTVTTLAFTAHGLSVGQQVQILISSDSILFPVGIKTITSVPSADTFTYAETGADGTDSDNGTACTLEPELVSTNGAAPHGVAISKPDRPEAVPLSARAFAGSGTQDILRSMRLGETLFLFKQDGLFRMLGEWPSFSIKEFDPTVILAGTNTVARVGTRLYALCTRGVLPITESGVGSPVSGPIDTDLENILTAAANKVRYHAHAVGYESRGEYHLHVPASADDLWATQSYVLNVKTGAWVHSDVDTRWGLVDPFDANLYLAAADSNSLLKERRTLTAADYQDATGAAIPLAVQWSVFAAGNPTTLKSWQKVTLLFGSAKFSRVTVTLTTELNEEAATIEIDGAGPDSTVNGPRSYSFDVPYTHSISTQLNVTLEHAAAGERLSLHGAVVTYELAGDGVGR